MVERDALLRNNQADTRENENLTQTHKYVQSNNILSTNYLTSSLVNTQGSNENYNSFGGINQNSQTFKSKFHIYFILFYFIN